MAIGRTIPNTFSGKQNYILAIGVDKYEDSRNFRQLQSCKRDVSDFVKIILSNYQCFNENSYKTLFNESATKENILSEIRNQLYKPKASEWNLIIYFAGHGHYNERTKIGHWIPYDAIYRKYTATYISFEEITKYMVSSSIHHILLISDSCHAGSIFANYRSEPAYLPKYYKISSRWGLTSGRRETVDDGTNRTASPFSQVLSYVLDLNAKIGKELSVKRLCVEIEEEFGKRFVEKEQMPDAQPLGITGHKHNNGQFVFIPKITSNIPLEIDGKPLNDEKDIAEKVVLSESQPEEGMSPLDSSTNTQSIIQKPNFDSPNLDTNLEVLLNEEKDEGKEHRKKLRAKTMFMSLFILIIFMTAFSILMQERTEPTPPNSTVPTGAATASVIITTDLSQPLIEYKTPISPVKVDDGRRKALRDDSKIQKTSINTHQQSDTSKSNNIIFAGSFVNKDNALNILTQLRKNGFQNTEIVMKQDLPYMTVVTDFNAQKREAKKKVQSLEKKGIKAYHSETQTDKIYRKKKQ